MTRAHNLLISFLLFCTACQQRRQRPDLTRTIALMNTLETSNRFISGETDKRNESLKDTRSEKISANAARRWIPKVRAIRRPAEEIYHFIDSLKKQLKTLSVEVTNTMGSPQWEDRQVAARVFDKDGGKKELLQHITSLRQTLLHAWDSVTHDDPPSIYEDLSKDMKEFTDRIPVTLVSNFTASNISLVEACIFLDQVENDLRFTEYLMVDYSEKACHMIIEAYEKFSVLIGANSTYLKAGQTLTISAGVGQFSIAAQPKATINGIPVTIGKEGIAEYNIVVGHNPGKHTIPVNFEFTHPDGRRDTIYKSIHYEIAP